MFELTNAQRSCFALKPVREQWERIEIKASPYDQFKTYLYLNNDAAVKCILSGTAQYCEYELDEKVSQDKKYLLPKTTKGKPVLLSSSNILKRKGTGMCLSYAGRHVDLYNANTECSYYSSHYLKDEIRDLDVFVKWVEKWCNETTDDDRKDVLHFSQQKRQHICYQEGDVFRFRIDRRLYGYGRILLDYDRMRKKKELFWDILMGKPLACSVYHIATERDDVSVEELKGLRSLPSTIVADNSLFYGEHKIIGNLPISGDEDYPVLYGDSIRAGERAVCYQRGKIYRKIENGAALFLGFANNGVGFKLNLTLEVLLQCIKADSNEPYWKNYYAGRVRGDLRNPKHAEKLQKVKEQFGL